MAWHEPGRPVSLRDPACPEAGPADRPPGAWGGDAPPGGPGGDAGPPASADAKGEALHLSLSSWEGPLDLLLDLARRQRVDLASISVLELVDQFLAVIRQRRSLRLEVAADWLVMAAWLVYLKSAALLPRAPAEEPDSDRMAEALRWRLRRLEAMRRAAGQLLARPLLGRDVHLRGAPEGLRTVRESRFEADLTALLLAYGAMAARRARAAWAPVRPPVVTLEEALARLSALLGEASGWRELAGFLVPATEPRLRRSALASGLLAALELARQGRLDLAQAAPLGPVFLRRRPGAPPDDQAPPRDRQ